MSDTVDALVYAQLRNNVTPELLGNQEYINLTTNLNLNQNGNYQEQMNTILSETTLKRACCLSNGRQNAASGNPVINVQIPIPADITSNPANSNLATNLNLKSNTWGKYGYIEKQISIPSSMCGNYTFGNNACNNFYQLYCQNSKAFFANESEAEGVPYNDANWILYKPECACYITPPPGITASVSPSCYSTTCSPANMNVYAAQAACDNVQFCQQVVNIGSAQLSGGSSINIDPTNKCNTSNSGGGTATGSSTATSSTTVGSSSTNGSTPTAVTNSSSSSTGSTSTPTSISAPTVASSTLPPTTLSTTTTTSSNTLYIGIGVGVFLLICCLICMYFMMGKKRR